MSFEFLADAAAEVIEAMVNKKGIEMQKQKQVVKADKPQVVQEIKQIDLSPVQPSDQTASPVGTSCAVAASSMQNKPATFELNSSNIIQAVIYSELLTEPVCRRKGRWRNWS